MPYDEIEALTVSQASSLLHALISESFYQITISGEVAGFHPSSTGHWYFTLKDESAVINAAVFRTAQYNMPEFKNGDEVIAKGRIDYYEKGGKITFIIEKLSLKGDGELLLRIEKRKEYYKSLGWFDIDIKKELPKDIKTIGVVTSITGAALQDILNITKRRAPSLDIIVFPAAVQGEGADITIASRIRQANNFSACDVLIVGRGGGSAEDLAPFSEDAVIEAIHESEIPVISAVGHEIDWPISDYVADLRAPTPSAAAELATAEIFSRTQRLNTLESSIYLIIDSRIQRAKRRLDAIESPEATLKNRLLLAAHRIPDNEKLALCIKRKCNDSEMKILMCDGDINDIMKDRSRSYRSRAREAGLEQSHLIKDRIARGRDRISNDRKEIMDTIQKRVEMSVIKVDAIKREAKGLSPFSILKRGYAVVEDKDGNVIKDIKDINKGDIVRTRLYKGEFFSEVEDKL